MNTIKKHINILLLGCCSLNFISCTDLTEEIFSDITEDSYKYEAGDATKVVGAAYTNLQDWGYCGSGQAPMLSQEICTDAAVFPANGSGWDDGGVFRRMHQHSWNSEQLQVNRLWEVCYSGIILANRAISIINQDDFPFAANENKAAMIAESRALRAFYYWYIMDNFGDAPLVTEPTSELPVKTSRKDLYDFIVKELKESFSDLPTEKNESNYGRFTLWGAKALLANVYLNAEVYTGTPQWSAAAEYSKKVMDAGFSLAPNYGDNFLADNNTSPEMILPICYDGVQTRSWSGLFFIASFISGDMNALVDFGTKEAWGGNRARMALVKKFASDGDLSKTTDTRASFWTTDRTFEINKPTEFTEGYSVTKFKNITKSGQIGHDPNQQFPDMDFPLFRLAEANLTFAEATIRAGGDKQAALSAINQLRKRAKATEITATDLTLDFVLDEKAREFYFEAQRRTDLIRYNKFTSNYTWDWKGETAGGTSISSHFSLLPIPSTQLVANSNLKQNPGY